MVGSVNWRDARTSNNYSTADVWQDFFIFSRPNTAASILTRHEEGQNRWVDDEVETVHRSIRLKSSGPTFSGTEFVCQKTFVTRVELGCVSQMMSQRNFRARLAQQWHASRKWYQSVFDLSVDNTWVDDEVPNAITLDRSQEPRPDEGAKTKLGRDPISQSNVP